MKIIGIGTDITEISRIEKMVEKHTEHFLNRVYTAEERQYSLGKKRQGEHLAGRWAAKEAVLKAIGTGWTGRITWQDVEVCNEVNGAPKIKLTGEAGHIADTLGIRNVLITISHSNEYAVAFAVAVGD